MGVAPLAHAYGLRSMVASTYQSVSGAGQKAMDELRDQSIALLNFRHYQAEVFSTQIAWNCIASIGDQDDDGYTSEERKMCDESRKILDLPDLEVAATCVRVPVFVGHAVSMRVELEQPVTKHEVETVLGSAPGVQLVGAAVPPTQLDAAGNDDILVGRIRVEELRPEVVHLWIVGDNLRKGAALNAVQVAERLRLEGLCP